MTRLFVIFNPAARGEKARRVRRLLEAKTNGHITLAPTQRAGDATLLAARAVREGVHVVVAAGGDGTINEVVNGLGQGGAALGVLPTGTVNVFARELGVPLDVEAAWAAVERGRTREIDLGCASANGATRLFVQLAGVGFDARAVQKASWELKKKIGPLSYVWAALKTLARPGPSVELDSGARGAAVLVGNGRFYGGSYRVFPQARLDDGLLDVCVFKHVRWRDLPRYLPAIALARHVSLADVRYFQTREVTCTAPAPAPFEVDGELAGQTPVRFTVVSRALRVIVP